MKTANQKLLHRIERYEFIDNLRHGTSRQGAFEMSMLHLDHPIPGTEFYLVPSDHGAGAERLLAAVERKPLWKKLWVIGVKKLKPNGRRVLSALMKDWRTTSAAKIAGVSRNCVDRWRTKFKMHFAQCWRAYKRDFAK